MASFKIYIVLIFSLAPSFGLTDGWHLATQHPDSFHPPPLVEPKLVKKNETHCILFDGIFERTAYNLGENEFNNDMFLLDVSDPNMILWTKVNYDPLSPVPRPRGFSCVVYEPLLEAVFLYGGVTYNAQFTEFEVFSDSWVFYFSNHSWVELDANAPPGNRGGMTCDYLNGNAFMTHGSLNNVIFTSNDTWKWNLVSNTWTLLTTSSPVPRSRTEVQFKRIPSTTKFILVGGEDFVPPLFKAIVIKDVWIFDTITNIWTNLSFPSVPDPFPEVFALAVTSDNWFMIQGGDRQGNLTVADTCKPPLQCIIPATPTDDNFFVKINLNQATGLWMDESELEHNLPPLKRSSIVIFPPILYLVGGMGWDGQHGVGEIYNRYTWVTELKNKYF